MNRTSLSDKNRVIAWMRWGSLVLLVLCSASCSTLKPWREKIETFPWRQKLDPLLSPFRKPASPPPDEHAVSKAPEALQAPADEPIESLPASVGSGNPEIVAEDISAPSKPNLALPGQPALAREGLVEPPTSITEPLTTPPRLNPARLLEIANALAEAEGQTEPPANVEEENLNASEAKKLGDSTHPLQIVSTHQGLLPPDALVLVQPGETLEFHVQTAAAPSQKEADGVKIKTRTQAKTVRIGARNAAADASGAASSDKIVRRLHLKASAGQVESSLPGKAVWRAPQKPGIETLDFTLEERETAPDDKTETRVARGQVRVQTLYPFNAAESQEIEGYLIGSYPNEKSAEAKAAIQSNAASYTPPQWWVRVTPEIENLRVSPHFSLAELALRSERGREHFIALDPRLLSFLEALRTVAQSEYGEKARIGVLRGYMSPAERQRLAERGIQYVLFSRYQYGNCAAIYLDLDGSGKMSDLNRDGQVNVDDARELQDLVRAVRARRQETGWVGTFEAPLEPEWPQTPFVAFDVRPQAKR